MSLNAIVKSGWVGLKLGVPSDFDHRGSSKCSQTRRHGCEMTRMMIKMPWPPYFRVSLVGGVRVPAQGMHLQPRRLSFNVEILSSEWAEALTCKY